MIERAIAATEALFEAKKLQLVRHVEPDLPEAQNMHEDDLSDERLMAILGANRKLGCKDLIHSVTGEVSAFTGDAPQSDDISMLAVRLAGN